MGAGPEFIDTQNSDDIHIYKYPSPLEFQRNSLTRKKSGVRSQKPQGYNFTGSDSPDHLKPSQSMTALNPKPKANFEILPRKFTTDRTDDQIYSLLEANPQATVPMTINANFGTPKFPERMALTPQLNASKPPKVNELKKPTTMVDRFS